MPHKSEHLVGKRIQVDIGAPPQLIGELLRIDADGSAAIRTGDHQEVTLYCWPVLRIVEVPHV